MFKHLRVKQEPVKVAPDPGEISVNELMGNFALPIAIRTINGLPQEAKQRIYRMLIPSPLLTRFSINPITWRGADGDSVQLDARPDSSVVQLSAKIAPDAEDAFFFVELADNSYNGINLNFLMLNDPASERFHTDVDKDGKQTHWGTVTRNLKEEERAIQAGLAPAQIRASLSGSQMFFQQLDAFLAFMGHQAISLEPLTYASAWVFEKRGFAYMRGHKLMDDIHREFQPGGALHGALDASTPFRQRDQWKSVRGRAWAIQDGILDAIGARWDGLAMMKQVGKRAGVNTFPEAVY
jgi:hypothetical protein